MGRLAGLLLAAFLATGAHAQTTFPTTLPLPAAIPDGDPFGLDLEIPVAGLVEPVVGVDVELTYAGPDGHTWVGDLDAFLSAPSFELHTVFYRVGSTGGTGTGDSSNALGPYTFTDRATGDFWQAAGGVANNVAVPAGRYRTLDCCAPTAAGPGVATEMDPVFLGLGGNGTWTLRVTDAFAGDGGSVAAANLTIWERSVDFSQAFVDDPVPAGGQGTLELTLGAGTDLTFRSDLEAVLPGLEAVAVTPGTEPCGAGSSVALGPELVLTGGTGPCTFAVTVAVPVGTLIGGYPSTTSVLVDAGPLAVPDDDAPVGLPASDTLVVAMASADVSVTKTDGVTSAVPGRSLTTTIAVANGGPSRAPAVGLADPLPAALDCSWSSLAAGGATGNTPTGLGDLAETLYLPAGSSVTYTLDCQIDPAATGTLVNTATATSGIADPSPGNESATDDDTVLTPSVDLGVSITDGLATTRPGAASSTTIQITNEGPSAAPGTAVTASFPADLLGVEWSCEATPGSSCPAAGVGDLAEIVDLAPLGVATVTATGTVDESFLGTLVQTGSVAAASGIVDVDPANDASTDETLVRSPALVRGEKTVGGSFDPGGLLTYEIRLINESDAAQFDDPASHELVDEIPAELEVLLASADAGVVEIVGQSVHWDGPIGPGETVTILVEARILATVQGGTEIANRGVVFFDADGDGVNDTEALTEDPSSPGGGPTVFLVVFPDVEIPTAGVPGLSLLALLLAWAGLRRVTP